MSNKLSAKISILIVVSVIISVFLNGLYFDKFIKEQFFEGVKQKTASAIDKIISDIDIFQNNLQKNLSFVEKDSSLIASVSLINNYQDKMNYNIYLLDEEKKYIASQLYKKVKNSLNEIIVLYDKNYELVSYVFKDGDKYHLNFISYDENGEPFLYSKYENSDIFSKTIYKSDQYQTFKHLFLYDLDASENNFSFSYHYNNSFMEMRSHYTLFYEKGSSQNLIHIEMSKILDNDYFKNISDELDITIFLSNDIKYNQNTFHFSEKDSFSEKNINECDNAYFSSIYIKTYKGPLYIVLELDKDALHESLNKSRVDTMFFLFIIIFMILLITNFLLYRFITTPLDNLMKQISKVQNEDYSPTKIIRTSDEIEDISRSINNLSLAVSNREQLIKASQKKLEYLSTHDELTQLYNRRSFNLKLEKALSIAKKKGEKLAILFLDLDEFKQVNDTLGHVVGDRLLQEVSNRLSENILQNSTLARVGGDEFNIFVYDVKDILDIDIFARKIVSIFKYPFKVDDIEIVSSTSIGISIFPDDGYSAITLTKHADLAMYMAKDKGKNGYSFYAKDMSETLERRSRVINSLKIALQRGDEFLIYYQPKVSIKTGKTVALEALIRWNSSQLGFVNPGEFISIAEDTHMIIEIGKWVLKKAVNDFTTLKRDGFELEQISVNLSGVQLRYGDITDFVKKIVRENNIEPHQLELEITESYVAENKDEAIAILKDFRNIGVELAIDDFGTGYSSMSYLQKLPVTRLKVDKSFVDNLPHSEQSIAIVKAILALAEAFSLNVTIEGVEHQDQLEFFKNRYCDEIQGYLFSKPLKLEELKDFLNKEKMKVN
jgi:diguanylate cyclase (GGDEF)-like protein